MPTAIPARFVVGTGRCGSTLLSRMLSENAALLSIFEFFSGIDQFFRFKSGVVEATELAMRLRQDHPMLTMTLARGYEVPEVVYPFGAPGMRYALGDPIPWSLSIALPRISEDPDACFDRMIEAVLSQPPQPLSAHYRALLDGLTASLGKQCWIERSGSSVDTVGELVALFPEAKFVHIHRDGRETALSMREYPVLRVAIQVMYGLLGEIEYSHEGLSALERRDPGAIDRLLSARPPVELFGRYWSELIHKGWPSVIALGPERVLDLRFEAMVADPVTELRRIRDFFELPGGEDWIARGAKLVRGIPPLRFPELPPDEQRRLDAACADAMRLIGR
jgi:hypothetical protein